MRRKTGPGDITYCNTRCVQSKCKRNLHFWKSPTKFLSVSSFDIDCEDELHENCKYMWLEEENNGARIKTIKR